MLQAVSPRIRIATPIDNRSSHEIPQDWCSVLHQIWPHGQLQHSSSEHRLRPLERRLRRETIRRTLRRT
jgi:hypothetical protein